MIEGKNEETSTSELSSSAGIHYIFQSIFVKSLEEVDLCEDLTDDDIRTAIQNATGPKSALFVLELIFRFATILSVEVKLWRWHCNKSKSSGVAATISRPK
ncbi:Dynamin-related protein 3A, partial [Sarracenia purpurea var. burkii]